MTISRTDGVETIALKFCVGKMIHYVGRLYIPSDALVSMYTLPTTMFCVAFWNVLVGKPIPFSYHCW